MKIHRTLPKNEGFFGYYAGLIPTLFKVGFLSQIFSAIIETYILFSILKPKFEGATDNPTGAALLSALLLVALLESGLRVGATYSARAVLHKRFSGLDLVMTIFIFALSVSLLVCSLTLHIEGAKEAVEVSAGEAKREGTAAIDSAGQKELSGLLRSYSQDSATIAATYAAQIRTTRAATAARVRAYISSKGATGAGAESLKAAGAEKVAALEAERGQRFSDLLATKNGNLQTIQSRTHAAADDVQGLNKKRAEKHESKVSKYSGYLSVFSVLTVVFFLLTIILYEVYTKGSGINQVAIPTQYAFDPSVWSKFTNAVSQKFQYHARAAIDMIERSTPQPAAPLEPHPLYEWDGLTPARLAAITAQRTGPKNATQGATGAKSYRIPFQPNYDPEAEKVLNSFAMVWREVRPDLVEGENAAGYKAKIEGAAGPFTCTLFASTGGNTDQVATGKAGDIETCKILLEALAARHFAGAAVDPSDVLENIEATRARAHNNATVNNGGTAPATGGFAKDCAHCGKHFMANVAWQKFCSEDCKLSHHEAKRGARFDAKRYRRPGTGRAKA